MARHEAHSRSDHINVLAIVPAVQTLENGSLGEGDGVGIEAPALSTGMPAVTEGGYATLAVYMFRVDGFRNVNVGNLVYAQKGRVR